MSRNLLRTTCWFCDHAVVLTEAPRPVTQADVRGYLDEYDGMTVAHAECPMCLAKYLAWVEPPPGERRTDPYAEGPFYDLSFRSTFNDEPGKADLPQYEVRMRTLWDRLGPYEAA